MARICTRPFSPDERDPLATLTNTALNHEKRPGRATLAESGLAYEDALEQIKKIIQAVFERLSPVLERKHEAAGRPPCASILGFDLIPDPDGRLWLLEANASPSVAAECALDEELKGAVLADYAAFVASGGRERGRFVEV